MKTSPTASVYRPFPVGLSNEAKVPGKKQVSSGLFIFMLTVVPKFSPFPFSPVQQTCKWTILV